MPTGLLLKQLVELESEFVDAAAIAALRWASFHPVANPISLLLSVGP